jgi:hypothetical protein
VSHIPKFGDVRKSLAGDAASPNCGICDTAGEGVQKESIQRFSFDYKNLFLIDH